MLAVRADFACLALNFTLCSLFTGRYFVHDESPEGPGPRSSSGAVTTGPFPSPSGFVLPDLSKPCSQEQWEGAARAIKPTLQKHYWTPVLCPREAPELQLVPPKGALIIINGTKASFQKTKNKFCALAYLRKGSKLFTLTKPPQPAPFSTSASADVQCSRPGALEVCHRVRGYKRGEAPNPFGKKASFWPSGGPNRVSEKAPKAEQGQQGAGAERRREAKGAPVDSPKRGSPSTVKGQEGGSGGGLSSSAGRDKAEGDDSAAQKAAGAKKGAKDDEDVQVLRRLGASDPQLLINLAVAKLNEKKYRDAIELYDMVPPNAFVRETLLGRGTAFMLSANPQKALENFNEAVRLFPSDADSLRRRSSAFDSLGIKFEAFEDLSQSLLLDPTNEEARQMRGALAFHLHDYWTAIEDFNVSSQLRPNDPLVLNALGLALMGSGKYREAADFYKGAVVKAPGNAQLWSERGRAHKEMGQVKEAEKALRKALKLEKGTVLYHRLASLKHLTGHHQETIKIAEEGLKDNPTDIELNFLAAASKHALGQYIQAIKHYDHILSLNAGQNSGMLTQQFLAFYLREICSYTLSKSELPLDSFRLDEDMSSEFKVHWVKKMSPLDLFPGHETVKLSDAMIRSPPVTTALLPSGMEEVFTVADRIGSHAQYFVEGFMPNRRQYRLAGLAALDLMQRARATWDAVEDSLVLPGRSGGATGRGKASKGAQLIKNWRGMFNTLVRWRQLSEPVDTIAWIDGLGKEYIAGFGSITAMTVGQMENLKYYPQYKRAFELMKWRLHDTEEAMNATGAAMHISRAKHGEAILAAESRKALWEVVGENFFVTTQCHSYSKPGLIMNGTQLTLVQSVQSYDFAIRTPVTADRMEAFGHELQVAWEDLTSAYLDRSLQESNPFLYQQKMKDAVMRIGYFWFQLMPLARGSAMVGLMSLHGLSLAAGVEITEFTPKGLQIDWESILAPTFELFNESVAHWFFNNTRPSPHHLPMIMDLLPTIKHVIAALSYDM